jgi:ssDNA thymidine ADP-ribosyltransferase, DarT
MAKPPTYLYHITALGNLPSIATSRGLHCFNGMVRNGVQHESIAYESVQIKRARTAVTCGPRGCLHDYVPFFFAPRSPMLYAIHKGKVTCSNGQEGLACIVSSIENVQAAGLNFVFTDGHGIMAPLTNFYDDLGNLDKIDWKLMEAVYWRDTAEDPDRGRRRQAEFLVHEFFPWECVIGIGVNKASIIARVRDLLADLGESTEIKAKPNFFY